MKRYTCQHPDLVPFEKDMFFIIDKLKLVKTKQKITKKLQQEKYTQFGNSKKIFVKADRSNNFYEINKGRSSRGKKDRSVFEL